MDGNHYYGSKAQGYEATRRHKQEWQKEQEAVAALVEVGPVLDVPCGTGRYFSIYRDKGLPFVGMDLSRDMLLESAKHGATLVHGDARQIPLPDGGFGTVVCSRLLNWLYPADMIKAIKEFRRMADVLVLSIRLGVEGIERANYTHSASRFYPAIDGLYIDKRIVLRRNQASIYEIVRCRPPAVTDVLNQFTQYENKPAGVAAIAQTWLRRFRLQDQTVTGVKAEYWASARLRDLVMAMAKAESAEAGPNRMLTDKLPAVNAGPLSVLRFANGQEALIDGRRRANLWMMEPGLHPILVLECS